MRKLIGVTGPSVFTNDVIHTVENFFDANPVIIYSNDDVNLEYWAGKISALFLIGGDDLHPSTYKRSYPAGRNMRKFDIARDRREMKLVDLMIKRKKPILGICRGHQLLGVYRKKLQLVTDIAETATIVHCPILQEPKYCTTPAEPIHKIQVIPGRKLFGKVAPEGGEEIWVNSFHHQALFYVEEKHAEDQDIIGTAVWVDKKKIVELMECRAEKWVSCQWHPEWDFVHNESSRQLLTYFKDTYLGD